jgi:hypothetical protein
VFTWRERPREHFARDQAFKTWNKRYPGKTAGVLSGYGYQIISIDNCRYLAHRLAFLHAHGRWPADEIDHINSYRTDNRLENLREASRSENQRNSKRHADNVSGKKGVCWHKSVRKWRANIFSDGIHRHLGYFTTPEAAHAAYCAAAREQYGDFANAGE